MIKISSLVRWTKLVTIVGGGQIIQQGLSFIVMIWTVRMLSIEEYAILTLCMSMSGIMNVLSDGGIATAMFSEAGKVTTNRTELGSVIVSALELRRWFTIASSLIILPILFYLLSRHGASYFLVVLICLTLTTYFWFNSGSSLLQMVPSLYHDVKTSQAITIAASIGRTIGIFIGIFFFPYALLTLSITAVVQAFTAIKLRKKVFLYADLSTTSSALYRNAILKVVTRMLPNSLYYAFSGQIAIFIISKLGTTKELANIGALGRYGQLLSLLTPFISLVLIPRFVKIDSQRPIKVLKKYIYNLLVMVAAVLIIILITNFFSDIMLYMLGPNYKTLHTELVMVVGSAGISTLNGTAYYLAASRGIVLNPIISIPCELVILTLCLWIIPIQSLKGVILLGILTTFFNCILHISNFSIHQFKLNRIIFNTFI